MHAPASCRHAGRVTNGGHRFVAQVIKTTKQTAAVAVTYPQALKVCCRPASTSHSRHGRCEAKLSTQRENIWCAQYEYDM